MNKPRKTDPGKKLLISLLAGMLFTIAACRPAYIKTPVYAWWGTMYPQYCFSGDAGEDVPVKIAFRWLRIK